MSDPHDRQREQMAQAQRAYDNQEPPDDRACPECWRETETEECEDPGELCEEHKRDLIRDQAEMEADDERTRREIEEGR